MSLSIKKKIGLSFLALVFLFVVNSIYTIITLTNYKQASRHRSEVTDPSLKSLYDYRKMLRQSQMCSTNWVFLRYDQADKDSLKRIHAITEPQLKEQLIALSANWYRKDMADSLKILFASFEQLVTEEKKIMNSLQTFDDYDNPTHKLEAELLIEEQVLPRTATLMHSLDKVMAHENEVREKEETKLQKSSSFLTSFISFLAIFIIGLGLLLSFYLTKIITRPIKEIRQIVIDLSKGITRKVSHKANGDEIGEMIRAVNQLSDKFYSSALFANEVGKRNFDIPFKPLSDDDILGKALLSMRDNLKSGDEKLSHNESRLKQAQEIAHVGSWELNFASGDALWSDQTLKIFGLMPGENKQSFEKWKALVHPDDLNFAMENIKKSEDSLTDASFHHRIIRKDGTVRYIHSHSKFDFGTDGKPVGLVGIAHDVTEIKEAEEQLKTNISELKKTNAELDKFVYSVSHDLRAPLSSMLGVVLITEEETKEEITLEHLGMLKGSINKLDGFIMDILNYSRNSRLEVTKEEIDFKEMLTDITNNLKYMSNGNRKVEVKMNINNADAFHSDKSRISIVLNNLISNAIRYQNPKAENPFVNIEINTGADEACITVKDNGIGINTENQPKVFDMFYRVSSNSVGSGLGLYIVKETINKLNGHIEIESAPGKGTIFSIHIPNTLALN